MKKMHLNWEYFIKDIDVRFIITSIFMFVLLMFKLLKCNCIT